MSVEAGQIMCDRCDFRTLTSVLWGRYQYEMPDGTRFNLNRRAGWCYDCNKVVPVEDLRRRDFSNDYMGNLVDSMFKYESDIRKLESGVMGWLGLNKGLIQDLKGKIQVIKDQQCEIITHNNMVESRIEKERCLECSGQNISYLNPPEQEACTQQYIPTGFIHPNCNGQIMIGYFGFRIAMSFNVIRIYDTKGVFLRKEKIKK